MLRSFALALLVVSAFEIYLIIKVGQWLGAGVTLLLMILTSLIGAYLLKSQGKQALMLAQLDMQQGRIPGGAILDGLAILLGGVLLVSPGFMTDIVGLLLLLPLTRGIIKLGMQTWFANQIRSGNVHIIRKRW